MAEKKHKGPKSPHSDDGLADVSGPELDGWAAQEIDGFANVSRGPSGRFQGRKGGGAPRDVPAYAESRAELSRLAGAVLTPGRSLQLRENGRPVSLDDAGQAMRSAALRALVLESLRKRGQA